MTEPYDDLPSWRPSLATRFRVNLADRWVIVAGASIAMLPLSLELGMPYLGLIGYLSAVLSVNAMPLRARLALTRAARAARGPLAAIIALDILLDMLARIAAP